MFFINAFVYISGVFYTPFISSYYSTKGISPTRIGILLMIGPITAIFVQPFWGKLSDSRGKRKLVLSVAVAGSCFAMCAYYIGNSFASYIFATVLVNIFTLSIIPLSDAVLISLTGSLGISFSWVRLGGTLGYAAMAVFAGIILKRYPQMQFALSSCSYALLLLLISFLPKDDKLNKIKSTKKRIKPIKIISISNIFLSNEIYLVLFSVLICQIGLSFYSGFMGPYLIQQGYSQREIGIMNCLSALSEVPVLLVIDKIRQRVGEIPVLLFSCFMTAIRIFIFTGESIFSAALAQLLQGTTYMTTYYCAALYIGKNVREGKLSQGQGILGTVQMGMGAVLGSFIGGLTVDYIGFRKAFLFVSIILFVLSGFILTYFRIIQVGSVKRRG